MLQHICFPRWVVCCPTAITVVAMLCSFYEVCWQVLWSYRRVYFFWYKCTTVKWGVSAVVFHFFVFLRDRESFTAPSCSGFGFVTSIAINRSAIFNFVSDAWCPRQVGRRQSPDFADCMVHPIISSIFTPHATHFFSRSFESLPLKQSLS